MSNYMRQEKRRDISIRRVHIDMG